MASDAYPFKSALLQQLIIADMWKILETRLDLSLNYVNVEKSGDTTRKYAEHATVPL